MFLGLRDKIDKILEINDYEETRELLEEIKGDSSTCHGLIKSNIDIKIREELIDHSIDIFLPLSNWQAIRNNLSKEQKDRLLNKIKYFPSICLEIINELTFENEEQLDILLIGISKSGYHILECFNAQGKKFKLDFERNLMLYNKLMKDFGKSMIIYAYSNSKCIKDLREHIFNQIIDNPKLSNSIIKDIKILTSFNDSEKVEFYKRYADEMFLKYKLSKVGYISYCVAFKLLIGYKEEKLYIDKILKHMTGLEVRRHLNMLTFTGESKAYLDAVMIANKLKG